MVRLVETTPFPFELDRIVTQPENKTAFIDWGDLVSNEIVAAIMEQLQGSEKPIQLSNPEVMLEWRVTQKTGNLVCNVYWKKPNLVTNQ